MALQTIQPGWTGTRFRHGLVMEEPGAKPDELTLRRVRMLCYSYAVLWNWCALLFAVELMDLGWPCIVLGFLVAVPIYVVLGQEALSRPAQVNPGPGRVRGGWTPLMFVAAMAPFAVHACWPTLYLRFFFWRHEQQFQRIVDQLEPSPRVTRHETGTVIRYEWQTISNAAVVFVHEPGRRPGDSILSHEVTPLSPSSIAFDLHLGGAWYAARY